MNRVASAEKLKEKHPSCERICEEEKKSPAAVHPEFQRVNGTGMVIVSKKKEK
jgi:hypothetical protein